MPRVPLTALTVAVAAGAVGLLLGRGSGDQQPGAAGTVVLTSQQAAAAAPVAPVAPAAPAPQVEQPTAQAPTRTSTGRRDESSFWQLVGETRSVAGNDTGRQSELLDERLRQLPAARIAEFAKVHRRLDRRAYTWGLWGAAATVEDGCSADCFRDFRFYVISLGRDVYERALHNPDSLASVVQDAETGDWENADDVAPEAYSSVTGNDLATEDSDLSGAPSGSPINLDDARTLVRRYPRLASRFR